MRKEKKEIQEIMDGRADGLDGRKAEREYPPPIPLGETRFIYSIAKQYVLRAS
jgi:hypothetical protein